MAVYYKFKSAKDYDSIPIEGQFISLGTLKERIFESKHLGRGTDFDLTVSNAQNNEEYLDEAAMIPKNTSVLIRRVPRRLQKTIVTEPDEPKFVEDKVEELPPPSNMLLGDSSTMKYPEESEWDEFGNDLYAIPEVVPAQPSNPVMDVSPANKADEESKIKALIEMPALDWNRQAQDGYGGGRGLGRGGMGGRMMSGRGFGRGGFERPFERKTPPVGYICHRCKIPGHFIQHCPTNGDPNFDIRKVKPPTGIPKSMLMANPDGSYALPSGAVAVLKPNEAAFEKEIEGLPSIRPVSDLPPELRCPLCKEVIKDAVLTSKCCFRSFCDKCIRDYIITKSMCVCGATNILADDLLPNKTLRETISRILESATSSTENAGSLIQVQDMESARPMPPKVPSPTLSVASKGEPTKNPPVEYSQNVKESEAVSEEKTVNVVAHSSEKKITKNTEPSEATPESVSVKQPVSPESTHVLEEAQDKLLGGEQGKKKKKKKTRPPSSAVDMQWRTYQDLGAENYAGMPLGPSPYNPYWGGGMPLGVDGYMAPFAGSMPYMGYTPGPFDVPFGGMLPQDPFAAQGYMLPMVPRDLSELGVNSMGMNQGPPVMSREEFEARKADLRRKREMERMNEREHSRDGRGASREVSSSGAEGSSMRAKTRLMSRGASMDRAERSDRADRTERERGRADRPHSSARESARESSRRSSPPRPPKRKSSSDREEAAGAAEVGGKVAAAAAAAAADRKQKASVFSRISFPAGGEAAGGSRKKRKSSEPPAPAPPSKDRHRHHRESSSASTAVATATAKANGHRSSSVAAAGGGKRSAYQHAGSSEEEEEEEEEHHFKRRPSSSSRREEREREKRR